MKKSCKLALSVLLVLVMLLSTAFSAAADASITFKGFSSGFEFKPGSEYTETDLFEGLKNVMPGDVLTEEITLTNSAEDCDFITLSLKAVPHDETENPLSEGVAATGETVTGMSDFLSQLSMKIWNGDTLIYEASPDEAGSLADFTELGTLRTGRQMKLRVELHVPLELGNEYANRVGEVDWVFHVEAYQESQLSVRKVWADGNSNHAGENITVNLLKDGKVERSQTLNAENQWTYTFDKLVEGYTWTVEEANIPAGYTASYSTVGTMTTITNTPLQPPEETIDVSVEKHWVNNGNPQPESVEVGLYRDSKLYRTVILNEDNEWSYTWRGLSENYSWNVREHDVPAGYVSKYTVYGNTTIITNTYQPDIPAEEKVDWTVRKVWADDGAEHPDSVIVELLRDGEIFASEVLGPGNNWSHIWSDLDAAHSWNVIERDIPDGYEVSYAVSGNTVTITNTKQKEPAAPIDLQVKKTWDDSGSDRPKFVTAALYNGETLVEAVKLDDSNAWSHTWNKLPADGNWQIIEINIPKGYTPYYTMKNGVVHITNTASLIQTGQLNWPVPVLAGLGVLLLALGFIRIARKKKNGNV